MKMNFATTSGFCRSVRGALAAAALAGTATLSAMAQTTPDGTWDFVMSGARFGLAVITFTGGTSGGSFTGYEILVPKPPAPPVTPATGSSDASRGGDDGRGGRPPVSTNSTPATTNSPSGTNIFGFVTVSGPWGFDNLGRVVGHFTEAVDTNLTVGLSFFGRPAANGKRFNLIVSSPNGTVFYRGVLASTNPPNLSNFSWNGIKRGSGGQWFTEFFNTAASGLDRNTYNVNGSGPGYDYSGVTIVSSQNRIAFALPIGTNGVVRATIGPFNSRRIVARTGGWEQSSGPLTSLITFNAVGTAPVGTAPPPRN